MWIHAPKKVQVSPSPSPGWHVLEVLPACKVAVYFLAHDFNFQETCRLSVSFTHGDCYLAVSLQETQMAADGLIHVFHGVWVTNDLLLLFWGGILFWFWTKGHFVWLVPLMNPCFSGNLHVACALKREPHVDGSISPTSFLIWESASPNVGHPRTAKQLTPWKWFWWKQIQACKSMADQWHCTHEELTCCTLDGFTLPEYMIGNILNHWVRLRLVEPSVTWELRSWLS